MRLILLLLGVVGFVGLSVARPHAIVFSIGPADDSESGNVSSIPILLQWLSILSGSEELDGTDNNDAIDSKEIDDFLATAFGIKPCTESKSEAEPEPEAETEAEPEIESKVEPEQELDPEDEREPGAEAEPEPGSPETTASSEENTINLTNSPDDRFHYETAGGRHSDDEFAFNELSELNEPERDQNPYQVDIDDIFADLFAVRPLMVAI